MNTKLKVTAESMTKEEAFEAAIEAAARDFPEIEELRKKHDCFAVRWTDESGICEYAGTCAAAKKCAATWREAMLLHTPLEPRKLVRPSMRLAVLPTRVQPAVAPPPAAPAPAPKRRKRAKATSTVRQLRPVDRAAERFLNGLGTPDALPAHWRHETLEQEHKRRGRMVISRTASFVSVLIDGVMRLRFWTNAAGRALVDVVDELVPAMLAVTGAVEEIPEGSKKKSRPCTYRITLVFVDDDSLTVLDELAAAVLKTFGLEGSGE